MALKEVLFHGLGTIDSALLLNRLVLGVFFALSGFHKLFFPNRHAEFRKTLADADVSEKQAVSHRARAFTLLLSRVGPR